MMRRGCLKCVLHLADAPFFLRICKYPLQSKERNGIIDLTAVTLRFSLNSTEERKRNADAITIKGAFI